MGSGAPQLTAVALRHHSSALIGASASPVDDEGARRGTARCYPLAGATILMTFARPDGTAVVVPGAMVGDGSTGEVEYVLLPDDEVFDTPGLWTMRPGSIGVRHVTPQRLK